MARVLIVLALVAAKTALAGPAPLPVRHAPPPPKPPPAVTATVAPDAAKLAAELRDIGTRALAEAARQAAPIDTATRSDAAAAAASSAPATELSPIPALGPCSRPSYDERTKIGEQLARRVAHQGDLALRFGCKDAAGVIVALAFDQPTPHAGTGTWRVVRVAPSGITTLAEDTGPARATWMEFVHEVELVPVVALDLDGDRLGDLVLARLDHEGGAHGNATLSIWLSKSKRRIDLGSTGTLRDRITVAARQPAGGRTVVLRLDRDDDRVADAHYRCVEPPSKLAICPAVDPARRYDRAVEIATWFAGGHSYDPKDARGTPAAAESVPDRGLLAELLLPLSSFGVTAAERTRLFTLAAPSTPEQTIAHEVERVRGLEVQRQYGEEVERGDLRAGRLLSMLGDAACATPSATEARAAAARVTAWVTSHDKADVAADECKGDRSCAWQKAGAVSLPQLCVTGKQAHPKDGPGSPDRSLAYYEAQWSYPSGDHELARRAVFRVDGDDLTLLARASATGDLRACAECVRAVPLLTAKLYRHGTTLVALVRVATGDSATLIVDADGQAVPVTDTPGAPSWYTLGEDTADNVVRLAPSANEIAYGHWDAGWKQLARYPAPTARTPPPKLDPTGTWLWQQDHKAAALQVLHAFDISQWSQQPPYRAEVLQALAVAGADPATLGRATTATGLIKKD